MAYHILVTTDFSAEAGAAYKHAREQASLHTDANDKARVTVLTVLEDAFQSNLQFEFGVTLVDTEGIMNQAHARSAELIKEIAEAEFGDFNFATEVLRGVETTAMEIVSYADRNKVDLIVMSTHGRTGLGHFLLGSVTERVIRAAKVPVLVVPSRGA